MYNFAIVLFDHEGSGGESESREQLEQQLEKQLRISGWQDRAAVIVIDPELENWVWSDSPHVDSILGWQRHDPPLRDWLISKEYLDKDRTKPDHPKEALESALALIRQPRSSAMYHELAQKVSLDRCSDPSFIKFKTLLQQWFPVAPENK